MYSSLRILKNLSRVTEDTFTIGTEVCLLLQPNTGLNAEVVAQVRSSYASSEIFETVTAERRDKSSVSSEIERSVQQTVWNCVF